MPQIRLPPKQPILWAETTEDGNEYKTVNYHLRGELTRGIHRSLKWDYSISGQVQTLPATLALTGEPIIVVDAAILGVSSNGEPTASNPEEKMEVWPNPAQQDLFVKLPTDSGNWQLEIFDMLGRATDVKTAIDVAQEGAEVQLQIGSLSAGTYVLRASSGQQVLSQAVIVQ
jgi:hypothetical protein